LVTAVPFLPDYLAGKARAAAGSGTEVTVNDEGFLTDPAQWHEDMAPQIAAAEGIGELTGRH
jgi:sulfur relay (sulfurtransferase) DsrC/TusE family protein